MKTSLIVSKNVVSFTVKDIYSFEIILHGYMLLNRFINYFLRELILSPHLPQGSDTITTTPALGV